MSKVYKKVKKFSPFKTVKKSRRRKRGGSRNLIFSIFGFFVFILLGGVGYNYFIPKTDSREMKISGITSDNLIKEEDLKKAIDESFKFSYSLMGTKIETDNFLSSDRIKLDSILKKFPQIENIDIKKNSKTGEIVFDVKEKNPSVIWCEDGKCMLADSLGVYFRDYNNEEKYQNLPRIEKKEWGDGVDYRKKIVGSVSEIGKSLEGIDYFKKQNYFAYSDRLVLTGEGKCEFIFNFNEDISWQLEKMRTILKKEEYIANIFNYGSVDLRFKNQAIIKKINLEPSLEPIKTPQ